MEKKNTQKEKALCDNFVWLFVGCKIEGKIIIKYIKKKYLFLC